MSSILAGYEYDIFISYRQNENQGVHWVSDFVKNLKMELDTTLKVGISIYFDENPHDGLQETKIERISYIGITRIIKQS